MSWNDANLTKDQKGNVLAPILRNQEDRYAERREPVGRDASGIIEIGNRGQGHKRARKLLIKVFDALGQMQEAKMSSRNMTYNTSGLLLAS